MPLVLRPPGLPGRIGGFRGQSWDGQEGLGAEKSLSPTHPLRPLAGSLSVRR